MGIFDRIFKRPANFVGNISREAFPVTRPSTVLAGLSKLVGEGYIARLESSFKYKGFEATMAERRKLLGIYNGSDTNSHLADKFTDSTLQEVILASTNIVDRAIRRMALVYKDFPDYKYKGKGEDEDGTAKEGELPDDYSSVARWLAFKNAERLSNLLGTVAIRPVVRGDIMQCPVVFRAPIEREGRDRIGRHRLPIIVRDQPEAVGDMDQRRAVYW